MSRSWQRVLTPLVCAVVTGCASSGAKPNMTPADRVWPVTTHEHVDLWLHGYALLTRDLATVPVFRRGYRDSLDATRAQQHVLSGLDINHARLATLMAQNPEITNGEFLPLYFDSWTQMTQAIDAFVSSDGSVPPRDMAGRQHFSLLSSFFPTAQDREWLRLFAQSEESESNQFYHAYWMQQQNAHAGVVTAVDSLFRIVRPRLQGFMTHTQQTGGELVLSLVLGGEGRTLADSPDHNVVTVNMPPNPAAAADAIYGFVHEIVQNVATTAVDSNTSAQEQRDGSAASMQPIAAVRAGDILLQRTAPELVNGYERFYLEQAGVNSPDAGAAFATAFALPEGVLAGVQRQIDKALGGI